MNLSRVTNPTKNRYELSAAGLNLEKLNTILSEINQKGIESLLPQTLVF